MMADALRSLIRRRDRKAEHRAVTAREFDALAARVEAVERENFELKAFVIRLAAAAVGRRGSRRTEGTKDVGS